jgi:vesicle-fusing ATPase
MLTRPSRPAFGTDESELEDTLVYGIIHFSPYIQPIINQGLVYVENVRQNERTRLMSVLISGPEASGKTALAAHIVSNNGFQCLAR